MPDEASAAVPPPAILALRPIGIIRTPFPHPAGTPIQPSRAGLAPGQVHLHEEFREALKDLEGFERIWLIYWLHRAPPAKLLVIPFLDTVERGIFATRSPARPNPIGISAVRLLRVDGLTLEVEGADMLDGTPLLDIKPYVSEFDSFSAQRAGWLDDSTIQRNLADNRFDDAAPEKPES